MLCVVSVNKPSLRRQKPEPYCPSGRFWILQQCHWN